MSTPVLDVTAGSRMMWFDKADERATFGDIRCETLTACDGRSIVVDPDVRLDFRCLSYPDEVFDLVVFDPPHLNRLGKNSFCHFIHAGIMIDNPAPWAILYSADSVCSRKCVS